MQPEEEIAALRRRGGLTSLPDGSEGVPISMQFQGAVPPLSRPGRREWLQHHFEKVVGDLKSYPLQVTSGTLSVSGQSLEAVTSTQSLTEVKKLIEAQGHEVKIVHKVDATS